MDNAREAATAEGGDFEPYDGPTPPKGVYRTKLRMLRLKVNKNGDNMLNGLFVIDEKDPKKKKYNTYPMWWNGNVTEQGAGYINKFLDAFGFDRKAFWAAKVVHDGDGDGEKTLGNITKIGSKVVKEDTIVYVSGRPNNYNGETSLQVGSFLLDPPKSRQSEEDEDEDDDDYDDELDEDEDEDDDVEDEDDDEEEAEPPKRRSSAKTSRSAGTRAKSRTRSRKQDDEDDEDDDEVPF